jgi:murein DD-endopeptidase MepM/ murein hydrolase activator NlpD
VWQGRKPEITDGFSSKRRTPAGDLITHGGVDIMYRRHPGDAWRTGTPHGTPNFVMPDDRAALAASDGVVSLAAKTPRGWTVIIDHAPRKLATYYTHLSSLLVATKQKVTAGMPLGVVGADPLDGEHLMHLHFEVWRDGASDRVDPQPLMASWEYLRDPAESTGALVARNAKPHATAFGVPVKAHMRRWPRHGG